MNVIAKATRSGKWWAIEVPEIPGLYTQTRRLDEIPAMVSDAANLLGYQHITVTTDIVLPKNDQTKIQAAIAARQTLKEAEHIAARASRDIVAKLRQDGLQIKDIAQLLEVTPQRVSQLAAR